jgi:hypothetical protein
LFDGTEASGTKPDKFGVSHSALLGLVSSWQCQSVGICFLLTAPSVAIVHSLTVAGPFARSVSAVTAVQNYRSVAGEQHQIHLNTQVLSLASHYNNFPVEGFYIETTNRQTAQCRSTGDPHYTTFDGKYWHVSLLSTVCPSPMCAPVES